MNLRESANSTGESKSMNAAGNLTFWIMKAKHSISADFSGKSFWRLAGCEKLLPVATGNSFLSTDFSWKPSTVRPGESIGQ